MDALLSKLENLVFEINVIRKQDRKTKLGDLDKALHPKFSALEKLGWTYEEFRPDPMPRCAGKHYRIYHHYMHVIDIRCCTSLKALLLAMTAEHEKSNTRTYVDSAYNRKLGRVGKPYR